MMPAMIGNSTDKSKAMRLLHGLEMGGLDVFQGRMLAEELDPVLVNLIVRYLREAYPASDPAASPVLERVVALTDAYPGLVARARQGEQDSVTTWFTSERSFKEFRGRGEVMLDLVIDKLES